MLRRSSLAAAAVLATAGAASANHLSYFAVDLDPENGSGVNGRGAFTVNSNNNTLTTRIFATGLEAGMPHAQHIHGRLDDNGNPIDSVSPTQADDADGDGFVELFEAAGGYGPILVGLTDEAGNFPTAPDGTINYKRTFDLGDASIFGDGFDAEDVIGDLQNPALDLREIVVHGLTIPAGVGGFGDGSASDDLFSNGGYSGVLPVATGEITATAGPAPVPLPAAGWALLAGLGGLGALRRTRRS